MKIACSVEYNGYGFCGWQKQPKTLTIQGLIEKALFEIAKKILKPMHQEEPIKGFMLWVKFFILILLR